MAYGALFNDMGEFCIFLSMRAVLHTFLSVVVCQVAMQFCVARVLHLRLKHSSSHVTTQGTVTRVKEIGTLSKKKVLAWLRFDEDICETQTSVSEHDQETMAALFRDDSDWPPESNLLHAVVTGPEDRVSVGDTLEVVLIDDNPSSGIYLPYQKRLLKMFLFQAVRDLFIVAGILFLLKWSMNVPIFFASSEQIEQAASASSLCQWFEYGDDEVDGNNKDEQSCCTIPWHVALAYNLSVSIPVVAIISISFNLFLKARRLRQPQHQAASPIATTELTRPCLI
jgi:hypothetical protein